MEPKPYKLRFQGMACNLNLGNNIFTPVTSFFSLFHVIFIHTVFYYCSFEGKMDQIFDIDGTGISSALGPGMSWKDKGNDSNSMSEKRNENEGEILVGNYGHETDSSFFSYKYEEEDDEDEEEKEKEKEKGKGLGENEKMQKKDDNYEIDVEKNPPSNTKKIDGNDYEIVNTDTVVNPMMINVSVMGDDDDEEGEDNDEEEIDGVNQIRSKR